MAECADFVVIDRNKQEAAPGKWRSPVFATGARNTLTVGGVEKHNAYITLVFLVPKGVVDGQILIRIHVNGHPLPDLVSGWEDTANTAVAAFPASFLKNGGGNMVELHARGEKGFTVRHAIVHFRQDT